MTAVTAIQTVYKTIATVMLYYLWFQASDEMVPGIQHTGMLPN